MDPSDLAHLNAYLLLDAIRARGTATRGQLAEELGLSQASVSRIVRNLLDDGSVEELPGQVGDRGRTPGCLRFVPRVGSVIALDLGGTKCHGVLADLGGQVVSEDVRPTGGVTRATATVFESLDLLRHRAATDNVPVEAIVIGIPALIDPDTGLASAGPNVGWEGFDLLGRLREHLSEPIEVDNDVNLAALGQAWRGDAAGRHSFVVISIGTGVGAGVVVDGRLIHGAHNAAGEIGQLLVSGPHEQALPAVTLEEVASGPAIARRYDQLEQKMAASSRPRSDLDTADVFAAATAGDPIARQVIAEVLHSVAAAVVNLAAVLDPELVVLDGSVGRAIEPWLSSLSEKMSSQLYKSPSLAVSHLGPNATLVGAMARGLALASENARPAMPNISSAMTRRPGFHQEIGSDDGTRRA